MADETPTRNHTEYDENAHPQPPRKKTVVDFLRRSNIEHVTDKPSEYAGLHPLQPPVFNVARFALDAQHVGALHPWASSQLRHAAASTYTEHRLTTAACPIYRHPGSTAYYEDKDLATCLEFDSTGELLVLGSSDGSLTLFDAYQFPSLSCCEPTEQTEENSRSTSILKLCTPLRKVNYMKWNPVDENQIAVASKLSQQILAYDLSTTKGESISSFVLPTQNTGGLGCGDISFCASAQKSTGPVNNRYCFLAGGQAGQIFLWDGRAGRTPTCSLQSPQAPSLVVHTSLIDGNNLVLAGTAGGDVKIWDIRGGSGGALHFGGILNHHPIVSCTNLENAVRSVPGLIEQAYSDSVGPLSLSVHSMAVDPSNPARVGFTLGNGWSGVLDVTQRRLTHIHTASTLSLVTPTEEGTLVSSENQRLVSQSSSARLDALEHRRQAKWAPDSSGRFVAPLMYGKGINVLEFGENRYSRSSLLYDDAVEDGDGMLHRVVGAVAVDTSEMVTCAAVQPVTGLIACARSTEDMFLLYN